MPLRGAGREIRVSRRVKLRDLSILSTVVASGSMADAARRLGMSQPAVSESIAKLEETLQISLLDRGPKGVEPTIYARALLKRGNVVFDELEQAVRDIESLADPGVGEVRIGCPESLLAGFAPAIIDRMSRRYPLTVVDVVNAQPGEQQFQALQERKLDLMLGRVLAPLRERDIEVENLCEDRFFVVAGKESLWARRRKISLAELRDEPWIMFPNDSLIQSHFSKTLNANGWSHSRGSVTSFSMNARMQLLATGRFLTILHSSALRYCAKPWALKVLPVHLPIPPVQIALFTVRHRTLSPAIRNFIEQTREVAESLK